MLVPTKSAMYDSVKMTVSQPDLSYSVQVEKGVEYNVKISGVNDYEISAGGTFTANADLNANITVSAKPVYAVNGNYIDKDMKSFIATGLTKLIFTNLEDDYTYEAAVTESNYTISLRDGSYSIEATGSENKTKTHVVVNGGAVSKDLMFNYQAPVASVPVGATDIYVGYPGKDCNYENLTDAVRALNEAAPSSESERIIVHIAPGEYREQLKITASYITFVNEEPQKGEVRITGYYGIGHEYYSLDSNGFYDIELAYDKFEKTTCTKSWGTTVYLAGGYFRAENIHFENSFNKYVTQEEIEDGAGLPNGALRTLQTDVTTKANTERAAAIVIGGSSGDNCDYCEFYKCTFTSSQDTLFVRRHAYFRNCFIEGNTDYIFGEAGITCLFDACELSFAGYGGSASAAYITANRSQGNNLGTIFRNCVVTNKEGLSHTASYFGRTWDAYSRVTFLNTKIQNVDTMIAAGWKDMNGAPEDANYAEYGTVSLDGAALELSGRVSGTVKDDAFAGAIQVEDLFEGWMPYYYYTYKPMSGENSKVALVAAPVLSSTGNLENVQVDDVLDVEYSIGENEDYDTSVIQWIRVASDGTEEVLRGYSALQSEHKYTVTELDNNCEIKVVIKPETISGYKGTEASASVTVGTVSSDKGLRKYNQEGYAAASGTTGGGIQTEDSDTYYKVSTATEFLNALAAVRSSGKPSIIEIAADIALGSKEVANFSSYGTNIIQAYGAAPLTHPRLLQTGVSIVSLKDMKNLTIFSKEGNKILHANFAIKGSENIIIRNVKFDELWEWDEATNGNYDRNDWDYMTIDSGSNRVWIDHCTFYKAYDGIIDVKNPAPTANVTISWCEFLPGSEDDIFFNEMMDEIFANPDKYPTYQHMLEEGMTREQVYMYAYGQKKTHLFGQDDSATNAAGIQVTLANNYYKNSMDRMPRLRYGYTHVYNCIMDAQELLDVKNTINNTEIASKIVSNGAASTCGGQVLLENCYINGIINALNSGNGDSPSGYINAVNSVYYMNGERTKLEPKSNSKTDDRVLITDADVFTAGLPYSDYILYKAGQLDELVQPYVGAGKLELTVVQWEKSVYADNTMPDTGREDEPEPDDSDDDSDNSSSSGSGSSSGSSSAGTGSTTTTSSETTAEDEGSKGSWQKDENGWWFSYTEDGSYAKDSWHKINGQWYSFDEKGYMETGWKYDKEYGSWFYLADSGEMQTGWRYDKEYANWFYLAEDGAMKTGWVYDKDYNGWFYMNSSGAMKTGWHLDATGKWYYLKPNGLMAANEMTPDGYFVNADGVWVK